MPYSKEKYGSRDQLDRYNKCVKEVSKKDKKVNPFAICRSSIYK